MIRMLRSLPGSHQERCRVLEAIPGSLDGPLLPALGGRREFDLAGSAVGACDGARGLAGVRHGGAVRTVVRDRSHGVRAPQDADGPDRAGERFKPLIAFAVVTDEPALSKNTPSADGAGEHDFRGGTEHKLHDLRLRQGGKTLALVAGVLPVDAATQREHAGERDHSSPMRKGAGIPATLGRAGRFHQGTRYPTQGTGTRVGPTWAERARRGVARAAAGRPVRGRRLGGGRGSDSCGSLKGPPRGPHFFPSRVLVRAMDDRVKPARHDARA